MRKTSVRHRRNSGGIRSPWRKTEQEPHLWRKMDYLFLIPRAKLKSWVASTSQFSVRKQKTTFLSNSYYHKASVTDTLNKLEWESLEVHWCRARLVKFYKIHNGIICIPLPSFIVRSSRPKEELPHLFKTVRASTKAYRSSFFVWTVQEWNLLPVSIGTLGSLPSFKDGLSSFSPPASL